jgi:hypothetical protein
MQHLTTVGGTFFRSIVAERQSALLERQRPGDVGRYHGPGQHALYMSPKAEWARLVANWYTERDSHARLLFELGITEARVLDLGDEDACSHFGIDAANANLSWRNALDLGQIPPSWLVANRVRAIGADGLIDRSRQFPGAWHVTLFEWNALGAPSVTAVGPGAPLAPPSQDQPAV